MRITIWAQLFLNKIEGKNMTVICNAYSVIVPLLFYLLKFKYHIDMLVLSLKFVGYFFEKEYNVFEIQE